MSTVVILNADYLPLQTVDIRHAVRMLAREVAIVEEQDGDRMIGPFPFPKVVRLVKYIYVKWRNGHGKPRYSRAGLLKRDKHKCAYCGKHADTVDHVHPTSKGGVTSWENCVASCMKCNGKKRNRTPEEANMPLLYKPFTPTFADLT